MPWKRRPVRPRNLAQALNIADLRELARRRVPHFVFEYVEGGAEDEATLHANRRAFAHWRLLPRTLIDTCARHTRTELFGAPAGAPLIIAPTGFNGMLSPEGDVALARARCDAWGSPSPSAPSRPPGWRMSPPAPAVACGCSCT